MIDATRTVRPRPYRLRLGGIVRSQARVLLDDGRVIWAFVGVLTFASVCGAVASLSTAGARVPASAGLSASFVFLSIGLQLLAVVVGADAIAGEFALGTIESSLTVCPRRGLLFVAKLMSSTTVVALMAALAGIVAAGPSVLVLALDGAGLSHDLLQAWARAILGLALGTGLLTVAALSVGALARRRSVAIVGSIVVLHVLPLLIALQPSGSVRAMLQLLLPSNALARLVAVGPASDGAAGLTTATGTGWVAVVVLVVWCLILVAPAAVAFVGRDLSSTSARRTRVVRSEREDRAGGVPIRARFGGLLRSELVKYRTLPSIRWLVGTAILLEIAFCAVRVMTGSVEAVGGTLEEGLAVEYPYAVTGGVGTVALLTAVLAAAVVAGEFETGTAVLTFLAAPKRWQVTAAKLLVSAGSGLLVAVAGLLPAFLAAGVLFSARGYVLDSAAVVSGAEAGVRATVFIVLVSVMSAAIAGVVRRSAVTVVAAVVLLVVGPALCNAILSFARATRSPVIVVGNIGRLLPWEGARFFGPALDDQRFATIDSFGVLQVSPVFGIAVTAAWAMVVVVVWFATDARRSVTAV